MVSTMKCDKRRCVFFIVQSINLDITGIWPATQNMKPIFLTVTPCISNLPVPSRYASRLLFLFPLVTKMCSLIRNTYVSLLHPLFSLLLFGVFSGLTRRFPFGNTTSKTQPEIYPSFAGSTKWSDTYEVDNQQPRKRREYQVRRLLMPSWLVTPCGRRGGVRNGRKKSGGWWGVYNGKTILIKKKNKQGKPHNFNGAWLRL